LPTPALWLTAEWNLPQLLGYLGSLSATARCRADTGRDPVEDHADPLAAAWGEPVRQRTMRWPLVLHLRQKPLSPEGISVGTSPEGTSFAASPKETSFGASPKGTSFGASPKGTSFGA